MDITIYSNSSSTYTLELKKFLQEKGVTFKEKFIDRSDIALKEMQTLSNGFLGMPFTVIQSDQGTKEMIVGFDRGKISSILGFK